MRERGRGEKRGRENGERIKEIQREGGKEGKGERED
jgi:hypothetical protein